MEDKKEPRKYQRREFVKQTGKAALGTALLGGAGYATGRTYKEGRDFYREKIKPIGEVVNPAIEKVGETKERLGDWWDKYIRKKQEEPEIENIEKESEKISRRGFFSKYFHLFNEHPVTTGTATGATLGVLVSGLMLYPQYLDKKKIAKLRDQQIHYEERLKFLEEYIKNLEKAKDPKTKSELNNAYEILNMSEKGFSGLEEKIEEEIKTTLSMLLSGISLIIAFILINGVDYTGFSFLSQDYISTSSFLGVIIIFTSFALIIIGGLRLRKIRKRQSENF